LLPRRETAQGNDPLAISIEAMRLPTFAGCSHIVAYSSQPPCYARRMGSGWNPWKNQWQNCAAS
jgi:hypothetical protein